MKKKIAALLMAITISFAGTFAPKTTQYSAVAQDGVQVGDVLTIIEIAIDLACPETPRQVCKGGNCEQGACISFRKHCSPSTPCNQ